MLQTLGKVEAGDCLKAFSQWQRYSLLGVLVPNFHQVIFPCGV
jgi:hypothetical protein